MNWREAFFQQAWSDYILFEHLNREKYPLCHSLHYLQMATEKLAKGYLCKPHTGPPEKTHYVLVRFLKISKGRRDIRRMLQYGHNHNAYKAYIDGLIDVAEKVERLAPGTDSLKQANAEYPWEDSEGDIRCPSTYSFPEFQRTDLAKLKTLISNLFRISQTPSAT